MKKLILIIIVILFIKFANAQWGQLSLNCGIYSFVISFAEEDSNIFAKVNCGGEWRKYFSDSISLEEALLDNKFAFYPNPPNEDISMETRSYKELLNDNNNSFWQSINMPYINNKPVLDLQGVPELLYHIIQSVNNK